MKFTKEELEGFKKDPLMNLFAGLLGTSMEELVSAAEKEDKSRTKIEEAKAEKVPVEKTPVDEEDEIRRKLKNFYNKMFEENKESAPVEDGQPRYRIKSDERYEEPKDADELVEEPTEEFVMSKDELKDFIRDYTKLENTFRKLEHTYGVDLNASADSIYVQFNAIVWSLLEKIFGEDNTEDILDYCFGDSNFDTVEDLYEELV